LLKCRVSRAKGEDREDEPHDGAVALLAQADQLVVLADNLGGPAGEVESERGLVGAKVIYVEDQLLREVLWASPIALFRRDEKIPNYILPDNPANARVDLRDNVRSVSRGSFDDHLPIHIYVQTR
jgi:hypothetical protein